ncbi:MAG TPA: hypothetical protein VGE00_08740 [Gammaproteobacteria bacterium]
MTNNILYLHPRDPHQTFNTVTVVDALRALGFIGDGFEFKGVYHYKPGEEFLHLLTFLGCSPVVALGEPGLTGEEFCHIEFTGTSDKPLFIAGDNVKVPRCRHCNQRIDDWHTVVEMWRSRGIEQWSCPNCGKNTPLHRLKWKQCAGFGRQFLKVWGIFEGEAVPGEELLNALRQATGSEWDYFYCRMH